VKNEGRMSGDFLPKLIDGKRYGYTLLWVSFECDPLSEEVGGGRKIKRKEAANSDFVLASAMDRARPGLDKKTNRANSACHVMCVYGLPY
jgi:hypothetical protein